MYSSFEKLCLQWLPEIPRTWRINLCLPQIPSEAEGRRRITAANQMFGPRFAGSNAEAIEIYAAIGEQKQSCPVGSENQPTFPGIRRALPSSGWAPLVAMTKTANFRYGYHGSEFQRLHGARFRRVLGQREVRPAFVIIGQEGFHVPVQGGLVENDHVVEALAANRADHSFHGGTLPRGSRGRQNVRHSQRLSPFSQ